MTLGTTLLAVQRGAVSTAANGTRLTFSRGPLSLDLGALPLGLFPVDGIATSSVSTLELLGSQGSFQESAALASVFGGDHVSAVTFLTRAVREGQPLTYVTETNVEQALAAAELGSEAEATVAAGVGQGLVAWIADEQLSINTFDTSGYVLERPETGAGGYLVSFERLVQGPAATVIIHSVGDLDEITEPRDIVATLTGEQIESRRPK